MRGAPKRGDRGGIFIPAAGRPRRALPSAGRLRAALPVAGAGLVALPRRRINTASIVRRRQRVIVGRARVCAAAHRINTGAVIHRCQRVIIQRGRVGAAAPRCDRHRESAGGRRRAARPGGDNRIGVTADTARRHRRAPRRARRGLPRHRRAGRVGAAPCQGRGTADDNGGRRNRDRGSGRRQNRGRRCRRGGSRSRRIRDCGGGRVRCGDGRADAGRAARAASQCAGTDRNAVRVRAAIGQGARAPAGPTGRADGERDRRQGKDGDGGRSGCGPPAPVAVAV